ncbi:alpha/beta fold hydrolase [Pseudophaeobacter sp. EL27]|uniref:alpha/beta fold hydrolase n=1 Tax=Pseudophaeobacter sp. EL27 TaxID=2107580 RepID=UPI000EFD2F91|nr:alpha/beta hydrolase [Pseudophaeobacter sp. EL27]
MTNLQPDILPSKEQIVAAIYETTLRPQLFDRFSTEQKQNTFAREKPMSSGPSPVIEAPELQAHFARALDILEQQWVQMDRPSPVKIWEDPSVPGWEDSSAKEEDLWILVAIDGELLHRRMRPSAEPDLRERAEQEMLSWVARAQVANGSWYRFVERIGSQNFSWQDILILETSVQNKKLLCRPIWIGTGATAGGQPIAILVELLDVYWPASANFFIAETFGLTPREVSHLRAFVLALEAGQLQTQGLTEIAAKAGAPGIVEFIRLVGFLLQEHARDMAIASGAVLPPSLQLRDRTGRKTQVFRLGAETGQPVIFVHGMMDGIAGVQHLQPQLRSGGFRVYAPLRGGYGASSPPPQKHQQVDAFVAQIEALIEQENLRRPLLLGHRSGVIFARVAALRLRGRIGGLVGVAPTPPLKQARDYRSLHRFHRSLALCTRFAPFLAPLALKRWSKSIRQQGASALVHSQARPGSKGWEQLQGMELDALLSLSLSLMMEQGGEGVLADLMLTSEDWREQVIGHAEQTIFLCGSKEALVRQQGLYPQVLGADKIQLRVCSGMGDVLLYVCPELVLAALEDLSEVQ